MPRRRHIVTLQGSKDTTVTPPARPYRWRARHRTRAAALRAAGVGRARISGPREEVPGD